MGEKMLPQQGLPLWRGGILVWSEESEEVEETAGFGKLVTPPCELGEADEDCLEVQESLSQLIFSNPVVIEIWL